MGTRLNLEQVPNYRTLGLRHNPFPSTGTVEGSPGQYFNQKNVVKSLGLLLSSAISTLKSANIVLTGTYGSGKSHTLRYIQSSIRARPGGDGYRPASVYVPQPGRSPVEFARQIMLDLGIETLSDLARNTVASYHEKTTKRSRSTWSEVEVGDVLLSDAIKDSVPALTSLTKFPDFSRAFVCLTSPDTQFDAWSWVCGERLDGGVRRRMGLTGNLANQDAMRIVVALVRVMHAQSVSPLVILLDEFEAIETLAPRPKQDILFNLRWLMDQCPRGLVLVVACAPEVWAQISSEYHAFSARIGAQVGLRPLKLNEVSKLISMYLDGASTSKMGRSVMKAGLMRRVYEISEGNVRRILMLCHESLEMAANMGSSTIDDRHLPPWLD